MRGKGEGQGLLVILMVTDEGKREKVKGYW